MRDLTIFDRFRMRDPKTLKHFGWAGDGTCGAFQIRTPDSKRSLRIIASSGEGWDHVSVSKEKKCPTWPEMEFIKRLFFKDDETVMQLHVPIEAHINDHPYCLHLWRPKERDIPKPPGWMVGGKLPLKH